MNDASTESIEAQRTLVLAGYILHLLGAVIGITSLIGLVINYVKRDGDPGMRTHHMWMIRSFWWAIVWTVIGIVTWWLLIGMAILFLVWAWYLYRHIRGLLRLLDGRDMPV